RPALWRGSSVLLIALAELSSQGGHSHLPGGCSHCGHQPAGWLRPPLEPPSRVAAAAQRRRALRVLRSVVYFIRAGRFCAAPGPPSNGTLVSRRGHEPVAWARSRGETWGLVRKS